MEDNEKHINQKPDEKYPAPSVPVNDAWADMKDMLDTQLPINSPKTVIKTFLSGSWKFIPAIVILTGLLLYVFDQSKKDQTIQSSKIKVSSPTEKSQVEVISRTSENPEHDSHKKTKIDSTVEIQRKGKSTITIVTDSANLIDNNPGANLSSFENEITSKKGRKKDTSSDITLAKSQKTSNTRKIDFPERDKDTGLEGNDNAEKKVKSKRPVSISMQKDLNKNTSDYQLIDNSIQSRQNLSSLKEQHASIARNERSSSGITIANLTSDIKPDLTENILEKSFAKIRVSAPSLDTKVDKSSSLKTVRNIKLLKDIHIGLHWNAPIPTSGYDIYFTGANAKNQLYTPLILGLWLSKGFENGNEVLLKLSPYQQHFANKKEVNTSVTNLTDSTRNVKSTTLLKLIGMSAGLQYNLKISDRWFLGVGAQSFLHQKALFQNQTTQIQDSVSFPAAPISTDSLLAIKPSFEEWKYMTYYHIAGNAEITYKWNRCQVGLGVLFPITSIVNTNYGKHRPVSGQLSFRWRIK